MLTSLAPLHYYSYHHHYYHYYYSHSYSYHNLLLQLLLHFHRASKGLFVGARGAYAGTGLVICCFFFPVFFCCRLPGAFVRESVGGCVALTELWMDAPVDGFLCSQKSNCCEEAAMGRASEGALQYSYSTCGRGELKLKGGEHAKRWFSSYYLL